MYSCPAWKISVFIQWRQFLILSIKILETKNWYLSMIDPAKSIDENIIRLFFRTDGYLYDETRNLLTQEFADITVVNNIVEQVASGCI